MSGGSRRGQSSLSFKTAYGIIGILIIFGLVVLALQAGTGNYTNAGGIFGDFMSRYSGDFHSKIWIEDFHDHKISLAAEDEIDIDITVNNSDDQDHSYRIEIDHAEGTIYLPNEDDFFDVSADTTDDEKTWESTGSGKLLINCGEFRDGYTVRVIVNDPDSVPGARSSGVAAVAAMTDEETNCP